MPSISSSSPADNRANRARIDPPRSGGASTAHSGWRDWTSLACGPAGLIAKRVLSDDVADYIRFRIACTAWRRCTADPRAARDGAMDRRFYPRRWIMLGDKDDAAIRPRHSRFLNMSTGECIRMELPELDGRTVLAPTSEGRLLLLNKDSDDVCLLNPLTGARTDLPPVTALLSGYQPHRAFPRSHGEALAVYGAGITDDSTVVVNFGGHQLLVAAMPGDEHWTKVNREHRYILRGSIISFAGRVYCVTRKSVMVVEIPTDQPPRLAKVAKIKPWVSYMCMDTVHLVDSGGELMVVHRKREPSYCIPGIYTVSCEVYRVDLGAGEMTLATGSFGGRAIFIGMRRTLAVPAGLFLSVVRDGIYLGYDCEEDHNPFPLWRRKGSIVDGGEEQAHPCDIVGYLCGYVGGTTRPPHN